MPDGRPSARETGTGLRAGGEEGKDRALLGARARGAQVSVCMNGGLGEASHAGDRGGESV